MRSPVPLLEHLEQREMLFLVSLEKDDGLSIPSLSPELCVPVIPMGTGPGLASAQKLEDDRPLLPLSCLAQGVLILFQIFSPTV